MRTTSHVLPICFLISAWIICESGEFQSVRQGSSFSQWKVHPLMRESHSRNRIAHSRRRYSQVRSRIGAQFYQTFAMGTFKLPPSDCNLNLPLLGAGSRCGWLQLPKFTITCTVWLLKQMVRVAELETPNSKGIWVTWGLLMPRHLRPPPHSCRCACLWQAKLSTTWRCASRGTSGNQT